MGQVVLSDYNVSKRCECTAKTRIRQSITEKWSGTVYFSLN